MKVLLVKWMNPSCRILTIDRSSALGEGARETVENGILLDEYARTVNDAAHMSM